MNTRQAALEKAIKRAGGQEALALALGVPQSTISYWLRGSKKGVAAEKAIDIERVTFVQRHELRPDLFPPPSSSGTAARGQSKHEHKGHFSRHKHIRRAKFRTAGDVEEHIRTLREEWSHR